MIYRLFIQRDQSDQLFDIIQYFALEEKILQTFQHKLFEIKRRIKFIYTKNWFCLFEAKFTSSKNFLKSKFMKVYHQLPQELKIVLLPQIDFLNIFLIDNT